MKKVLSLVTALLVSLSVSSYAGGLGLNNLEYYGEGALIGITMDNPPTGSNSGRVFGYFLLGASFDLTSSVQGNVALGYATTWGGLNGDTLNTYLGAIRVQEANLTFNELLDINGLSAKVGRQFYGDEDSTVMYLGIVRYNATLGATTVMPSIDAVTVYYDYDNIKANAIYGTIADVSNNRNRTLAGVDVKYSNIYKDMFDIQAYLYEFQNIRPTGIPTGTNILNKYGFYGIKPTFKMDGLKASLEYAQNYEGRNTFSNDRANTNLIKFDASYNFEDAGVTPRGTYFVSGGAVDNYPNDLVTKNFYTYGNYTPGLIYGQEIFATSLNQQIVNVGLDKVFDKYTFSADYYNVSQRDGSTRWGEEINVMVKYQYSKTVEFHLGVAHAFLYAVGAPDASKAQLGVLYKFQ
ncbi:MAG: hypothetical protein FWF00_07350 [Endomicrobia bacterium]|nr:hypothetical protein [Endomicrobiia bacterium]MCL2507482.1 hypothetical protein [Endomicrobiia bacterium]